MAAWSGELPALLVALTALLLPGLLVGIPLRLRGLSLWAFAPVASTATLSVLAVVYGFAGIPWAPWSAAAGCAVVVGVAWLIAALTGLRLSALRTRSPLPRGGGWLLAAGLTIGVSATAVRFAVYVGHPAAISQTNDAVFHLNALRYIAETANASSLHVNSVLGGSSFYPSAWHAFASLVGAATGADPAVAANITSLAIAAVVWPLGIAYFARVAASGSLAVAATAAALSAALPAFPMLVFQWGVLYSYALAVALVPAAAAVVIASARHVISSTAPRRREITILAIAAAIALAALALAQPATILAWLVIVVSWFAWWAGLRLRTADRRRRRRLIVGLVTAAVASAALWAGLARSTSGVHWSPTRGKAQALLDVALNGHMGLPYAVAVSMLMAIGLVVAVRRRQLRWLATAWVIFSGMYVVTVSIGQPILRRVLLGAWYGDPYRLAALVPLVVIPLAAIGLVATAAWAATTLSKRRGRSAIRYGTAWGIAALAALQAASLAVAPIILMPQPDPGVRDSASRYEAGSFLSESERALLERLPDHVSPGERVIGNPSTGTGFGYALSGVDVFPRTWAHPRTDAWTVITLGLRDAATDPAVCEALAVYGDSAYVLDFGLGESSAGRFELPAMTDFAGQPGFELVDEEGHASLWRITACDP